MLILYHVKFLFGYAKYCACFSKFLTIKRLEVILLKDKKIQLLSIFCWQDIPKNGCIGKSCRLLTPPQRSLSFVRINVPKWSKNYLPCYKWKRWLLDNSKLKIFSENSIWLHILISPYVIIIIYNFINIWCLIDMS